MPQVDAVLTVYADLRAALRQGDFAALEGIAARIEVALDALAGADPTAGDLDLLRAEALRAADLLDAAGRGVAAARRRIAEIDAVRQGRATYAVDGRRQVIARPSAPPRRV